MTRSDGSLWGHPHLVLPQHPQQQKEQQQHVLLQHPVLLQYTTAAAPFIEQRKRHYKQRYIGGDFPRYNGSSLHHRFDIDTHEGERLCNLRSEHVFRLGQLHEVAPGDSVRRIIQNKNVKLPASSRRLCVSSANSQRYHVIYLSRPIGNERSFVLLRTRNPNEAV